MSASGDSCDTVRAKRTVVYNDNEIKAAIFNELQGLYRHEGFKKNIAKSSKYSSSGLSFLPLRLSAFDS